MSNWWESERECRKGRTERDSKREGREVHRGWFRMGDDSEKKLEVN